MMNKIQDKALVNLSKAFGICKKAGISLCGMDDNLLAYDAEDMREAMMNQSIYEAQRELGQGEPVNHHHCYLDSGGW